MRAARVVIFSSLAAILASCGEPVARQGFESIEDADGRRELPSAEDTAASPDAESPTAPDGLDARDTVALDEDLDAEPPLPGSDTTSESDVVDDAIDLGVPSGDGTSVHPMNLIVTSNGREIGWVLGVGEFHLWVWDPLSDIMFSLNDSTGFVLGGTTFLVYNDPDCRLDIRYFGRPASIGSCGEVRAHRRYVTAVGGDVYGLSEPVSILLPVGEAAAAVSSPHRWVDDECVPYDESVAHVFLSSCFWPLEPTTEIPTRFELPIEVAER